MTCPDAEKWRAFLDGDLPDDEQSALTEHLESCDECPKLLESLAAGKETWQGTAEQLAAGDKASDPADSDRLRDVMNQLKNADLDAPRTVSPDSLTFLEPSENEEAIGQLAQYEILEIIGTGGMGIVLKAWDPSLRRIVAIKVLASHLASSATARRRFVREAQAAAAVSHDHVVPIHAVEAESEPPFLVMHYVEGRTLQTRIDQDGPLELREVLRIGEQTARGLAAAHEQGIIHRDIKPSNILLENGVERVRITDFGLARAIDDASMTQSGVLAGTPLFMAPEQAQGEPLDHRTDLFSLGSLLYAMCTGRSPFRASTIMGVIRRVCEDEPRPIREVNPDVPEWLCGIVERLLSKNPANRFSSADEVASLLSGCLAHVHQPLAVPLPESISEPGEPAPVQKAIPNEAESTRTSNQPATSSAAEHESFVSPAEKPLAESDIEIVREKLRRGAPGLKWAAIFNAVSLMAIFYYVVATQPREVDDVAGFVVAGLVGSAIMFFASRRLRQGDSLGWPTLAAVCCFLSMPGWPLGLPAAIRIWRTLREEDVDQYFLELHQKKTPPGRIMTGRQFAAFFAGGILNALTSRLVWVDLFAFGTLLGIIWLDLSVYHYVPIVEHLVTPIFLFSAIVVFSVFAFYWFRSRNNSTVRCSSAGEFFAIVVLIFSPAVYGIWQEQVATMGYVHVRVPTREAIVTLQRPGGPAELTFGSENHQTVRLPAGQWEWSVFMGSAEPLMSGPITVENTRVNIFEPNIPRGRELIDGVYSVKVFDRSASRRNLETIPRWLGEIPLSVSIRDGELRMSFSSEDEAVWKTRLEVDAIGQAKIPQVKIDLLDWETSTLDAIGSVGFSASELVLRLGFPDEPRPGYPQINHEQPKPLVTYRLIRNPQLEELQGTWKPVAEMMGGKAVKGAGAFADAPIDEDGIRPLRSPSRLPTDYRWQFSGNTLTSVVGKSEYKGSMKLIEADPPRLLWQMSPKGGQSMEGPTIRMTYRLRYDEIGQFLEVAFGYESWEYPNEMTSTSENGQVWIQFRREE